MKGERNKSVIVFSHSRTISVANKCFTFFTLPSQISRSLSEFITKKRTLFEHILKIHILTKASSWQSKSYKSIAFIHITVHAYFSIWLYYHLLRSTIDNSLKACDDHDCNFRRSNSSHSFILQRRRPRRIAFFFLQRYYDYRWRWWRQNVR